MKHTPSTPSASQKVMVIVGTRPEGIKLAPLIRAMKTDNRFHPIVVNTGQHRDMLPPILNWFDIEADYTLDVMQPGQPLAELSGKLLSGLHNIIDAERPDIVMVQGDTTTAFVGALSAYYSYDYYIRTAENSLQKASRHPVKIAHIEAGLRTYDNFAPFPEEANRRLIGPLATWHFAPTATAAQALFDENITQNVHITGNTVIDALFLTIERLGEQSSLPSYSRPMPNGLPQPSNRRLVLITGHRRESYGSGFDHICQAVAQLAQIYPNVDFVYPVHLNRHVHGPVTQQLSGISNVYLTNPLDYPDFINLMERCYLILTDSGGLQEEGPALGKPVLVMRDLTERPEGVMAGTTRMVGTTTEKIISNVSQLLNDTHAYEKMANTANPFGDGNSTQRILNILAGESPEKNTFLGSVFKLSVSQ